MAIQLNKQPEDDVFSNSHLSIEQNNLRHLWNDLRRQFSQEAPVTQRASLDRAYSLLARYHCVLGTIEGIKDAARCVRVTKPKAIGGKKAA